ncbi:MAG: cell wall hydrolase [Clostridia bacterium]|nr:cell wall hydrolase [Clostridia bacterium]
MKMKNKIGAAALALVITAGSLTVSAEALSHKTAERAITHSDTVNDRALTERPGATRWERYISLDSVNNKNVWSYARKSVKVGKTVLSVQSVTIGGKDYLPTRAVANALGLSYTYTSSTRSVVIKGAGLQMTFSDGCYVTYANDRALFSMTPAVILSDGRMYLPAGVLAKAFGLGVSTSDSEVNLTGAYSPITHASKYYREDEVFWLARIIHAEAKGEPLLGQIAVGNVVLNRVKSNLYPNTIYGVIFDRKYGVQFSPVLDGSIYNTPSFNSTLAAKICLEGSDVSDGVFFFLRPEASTSSWIPNNRLYAYSIGRHDFYY